MKNNGIKNMKDINQFDDEIDLNYLSRIFLRNKKLIIFPALLISFITAIFSIIEKPIWSGNFEVLIKTEDTNQKSNNPIAQFIQEESNINDEINLLKSPFVLESIFEYVKQTQNLNKSYTFKEWINGHITVDVAKESNIIEVTYKDESKDFILNILNKLSKKYKEYSISNLNQNLDRQIKFLSKQEKIYQKKYLDSLKTFNEFSIKNGLGDIDGFADLDRPPSSNILSELNGNNTAVNNLLDLQNQTSSSDSAGQRFAKQFDLLETLETQYAKYSSLMTEESNYLRNLKLQIDTIKSSLKRPNEILVKYKELKSVLFRNENVYNSIETNLINYKLERAKDKKTWDIISNPTINKYRVSPKRKKNVAISFLISTIFFYLVSIFKERKSNIVFELDELKKLINIDFKEKLDKEDFHFNINFLSKLTTNNESIIIKGSELMEDEIFENFFPKIVKSKNIKLCQEIDYKKAKNIFLFIEQGKITKKDITSINKYINLDNELFEGWIYLESK